MKKENSEHIHYVNGVYIRMCSHTNLDYTSNHWRGIIKPFTQKIIISRLFSIPTTAECQQIGERIFQGLIIYHWLLLLFGRYWFCPSFEKVLAD